MIKIGFWFDAPTEYSGGINYFDNLLTALSLVNDGSVQPHIFFPANIPENIENRFTSLAKVIKTRLLQRGTFLWLINRILYKIFGSMVLVNNIIKSYDISILSHIWFVYKGHHSFKIIGWIPDFQYLHLPELFPNTNLESITKENKKIIAISDLVILSSNDAMNDFYKISQEKDKKKGRVLQFVSQVKSTETYSMITRQALEKKYGFQGKYFFLPNQFWAHKNHFIVLKAVKLLKGMGINVLLLCSGNIHDLRLKTSDYFDSINAYIEENSLINHVKILGEINYDHVIALIKYSEALINPSKFEGWSSTVEEAKSLGSAVILSDIGVHIEQKPDFSQYFNPEDEVHLSKIMKEVWLNQLSLQNEGNKIKVQKVLKHRTLNFGKSYLKMLKDVNNRTISILSIL
jgi:hypothetical protein